MKSFFHHFRLSSTDSVMNNKPDPSPARPSINGLTVVELFQSQGCSSCPPTNSNVLEIAKNPELLVLTYDVTYWDHLGWKDTFGNPAFDNRQREYASVLQKKNVYTPQVIVNGQVDGVGNRAKDLRSLIDKGEAFGTAKTVNIESTGSAGQIKVSGPEAEHGVVVMIVYDSQKHDVPILHGENGGRSLSHSHVVKDVKLIGRWSGGSQEFKLPIMTTKGLDIAILVQAGSGGAILGAARL